MSRVWRRLPRPYTVQLLGLGFGVEDSGVWGSGRWVEGSGVQGLGLRVMGFAWDALCGWSRSTSPRPSEGHGKAQESNTKGPRAQMGVSENEGYLILGSL